MVKLGVTKEQLLAIPRYNSLWREFKSNKMAGSGRKMKGGSLWESFVSFLRGTKLLSKVGGVLLPVVGGALGTMVAPGLGTAVGTAIGSAGASGIEYAGFGKRRQRGMGGGLYSQGSNIYGNIKN